ncbi:MAG: transcription-repair coupling factor [Veillonellaceae bacterium]|nr:transcription-repair coupling factor [Veillonellaceae bacterium]
METASIIERIRRAPRLQELIGLFFRSGAHLVQGAGEAQQALLLAAAFAEGLPRAIVVTEDAAALRRWQANAAAFLPEVATAVFPRTATATFQAAARSREQETERLRALALLQSGKPTIVFATAAEAAAKIPAPEELTAALSLLTTGSVVVREKLLRSWAERGYERVDQVERRGHFAVRGDIVDVFSPAEEYPLRIEFFGDEIDSLRYFDTVTQRSVARVEQATVFPVTFAGGSSSLAAYCRDGVWLVEEAARAAEALRAVHKEEGGRAADLHTWEQLLGTLATPVQVYFSLISQRVPGARIQQRYPLEGRGITAFRKQWPLLLDALRKYQRQGYAVVLACGDENRRETLTEILARADIYPVDTAAAGLVSMLPAEVTGSFEWAYEKLVLITEEDIFGNQKARRRRRASSGNEIRYFSDLSEGDYVVHRVHGIGRYTGVETIERDGIHRDYLRIRYAGEDSLFLPVERIGQLEKYIAPDGTVPTLHRMGGAQWARTKARTQKSLADLADKLVALYAERELERGYAFGPDTPWQREFEEAFPYEETPDQLQATAEIKASMEKQQPMDRLLCGDVGFGKTEVAMRAVFKAVMSGKQVAVLVPTTVLSQQHFRTFTARLSPFGVQVAVLNRFRTAAEKKAVLRSAREGTLDVLIGTHALLNKQVKFHDLGLLVVDEEQRFGVAQKEKWKSRARNIDVLTLSATPIPRTLHMSLAGVRELSVIYTPPTDRQPVQTYVTEARDSIIRDAIRAEYERGGQVYFVYNRIASIDDMTEHLQSLVGEDVSFDIAHGAMNGEHLEQVMQDFYDGRFTVLVCTSLVENGLDQPNANTIIVYDADRLGLSQLYQMRGRVGRSDRAAFAYFLYRPDKILNETAEKRLYAIREFTELGAGFKIAMRDLEIRGAGNLLGAEQHGNMVGVGFATYCAMLDEEVAKRRGEAPKTAPTPAPVLELQVEAYIPEEYIADPTQKLEMYRRLAEAVTETELSDLTDELIDRFGTPPPATETLLDVCRLRILAAQAGIGSIRELNHVVEVQWVRPEAMADWDIGAVPDAVMESIRFLPSDLPRATINKIYWQRPVTDFLPQVLQAFLQRRNDADEGAKSE